MELGAGRERLSQLVEKASGGRGLRGLTEEELLEFGGLYRRTAADLAHARAHGVNASELEYLNWLVARAYGLLYVTESKGLAGMGRFYTTELPQTFRRHWRVMLASTLLFFVPALLAALLTTSRPDLLELLSPQAAAGVKHVAARDQGHTDWLPAEERPVASSMIMTNNIRVCFVAFAGGMLAGLLTVFALVFNGLILGAIAAGVSHTSSSLAFWSFVAPHGMVEIPTILISGAAGLLLARALIDPGLHTRADALRLAGRQAAVLMLGVVSFLVFAGLVEGFFSPARIPETFKFVAAGLIAIAFWSYLLLGGRGAVEATERVG